MKGASIIIPALNEEETIGQVIDDIHQAFKEDESKQPYEIIVVNDGSTDNTLSIAQEKKADCISHPVPGGYGLSIRDGLLKAKYNHVALIDADGTYPASEIVKLIKMLDHFDMVIGKRTGFLFTEPLLKYPLRKIFQWVCEFVVGRKIPDINSGLRAFRKDVVMLFKENFCLGFSFTTTITLAFHLNGYFIKYIPIEYYKRKGKSHVKLFRDSLRTVQIITEAILLYNPLKLFLLLSIFTFLMSCIFFGIYVYSPTLGVLAVAQSLFTLTFLLFAMGFLAVRIKR